MGALGTSVHANGMTQPPLRVKAVTAATASSASAPRVTAGVGASGPSHRSGAMAARTGRSGEVYIGYTGGAVASTDARASHHRGRPKVDGGSGGASAASLEQQLYLDAHGSAGPQSSPLQVASSTTSPPSGGGAVRARPSPVRPRRAGGTDIAGDHAVQGRRRVLQQSPRSTASASHGHARSPAAVNIKVGAAAARPVRITSSPGVVVNAKASRRRSSKVCARASARVRARVRARVCVLVLLVPLHAPPHHALARCGCRCNWCTMAGGSSSGPPAWQCWCRQRWWCAAARHRVCSF